MRNATLHVCFVVASVLLLLADHVLADDWPQWRGPNRDGISKETGLLKEWPKEGPKLLWQVKDLGSGYATPSVVGGRVYVLANNGLDNEVIKALDAKNGTPIWTTRLGKVGNPNQQPNFPCARSTPTVDGDAIYALSSDGDLACLQAASGKILWTKNLRADFAGKPGTWAYSESPLIDGNRLICMPGGTDATVIALDKSNGQLLWKCGIAGAASANYCSAIVADVGGSKQYVASTMGGLLGLDPASGKQLWAYDKTVSRMGTIPTPVASEGIVYSASNRVGGGAVKLTRDGDTTNAQPAYFDPRLPTANGGFLVVGDYLYGCTAQAMLCVEFKTGQIKWSDRGAAPGSLCYADGRLYLHGENGDVALVEATPEGYREHGRFTPPDVPKPAKPMEKSWPYPIVADGKLFIRDGDCLWCYDIKNPN